MGNPGFAVENERGEKDETGVEYSRGFRQSMITKLAGPGRRTATALAKESGVPQPTLSRWLREAGSLKVMSTDERKAVEGRRPQDWTAEEKLRAVAESSGLSEEDLGAFLRREGLHEAQLKEWREAALGALAGQRATRRSKGDAKRLRELEHELKRKDKALAETASVLFLQKKVQEILAAREDDTPPRKGK